MAISNVKWPINFVSKVYTNIAYFFKMMQVTINNTIPDPKNTLRTPIQSANIPPSNAIMPYIQRLTVLIEV